MLIAIVLAAEGLAVVGFIVFSIMLVSMYLDSRGMPEPKRDLAGQTLVGNAKVAFLTGMTALTILTVLEILAIA
ncbi:hypothetical protein [Roseibium sp.]|uniref:hypothetical protein n=1 Tax=Roseibium sp. TaxID=1936156 RepID=UPI003264BFC9